MALLLLEVAAVFYAVVAVLGLAQLKWPRASGDRMVIIGLTVSVVAHVLAIGARAAELGAFPIADLHDGLSFFGCIAAAFAIGISWKGGVPQAAAFASLLVAVMVGIAIVTEPHVAPEHLTSPWLPVHIAFAFLGEAAFAVAGMVAFIYLVQERRLKKKKKKLTKLGTGLHKLPALDILDNVSVRLIQLGFPSMAIGLGAGAIYSKEVTGNYFNWGLLNTVAVLVWCLFALLLHFRITIGWRGRRAAVLTLVGVAATLLALLGLTLAGLGPHGQGGVS